MSMLIGAILYVQVCSPTKPCTAPVEVARFVDLKLADKSEYCLPTAQYWNEVSKRVGGTVFYFCTDLRGKQL